MNYRKTRELTDEFRYDGLCIGYDKPSLSSIVIRPEKKGNGGDIHIKNKRIRINVENALKGTNGHNNSWSTYSDGVSYAHFFEHIVSVMSAFLGIRDFSLHTDSEFCPIYKGGDYELYKELKKISRPTETETYACNEEFIYNGKIDGILDKVCFAPIERGYEIFYTIFDSTRGINEVVSEYHNFDDDPEKILSAPSVVFLQNAQHRKKRDMILDAGLCEYLNNNFIQVNSPEDINDNGILKMIARHKIKDIAGDLASLNMQFDGVRISAYYAGHRGHFSAADHSLKNGIWARR